MRWQAAQCDDFMPELTPQQLVDTFDTWESEQSLGSDNDPALEDQQYVLFDEDEVWPFFGGWPS